jgi:hypothetical protein
MTKSTISIVSFDPTHRHPLIGFASVRVDQWKLTIFDLPVHEDSDGRWVGMPSRPLVDVYGLVRRDTEGSVESVPLLEFDSDEIDKVFSNRVVAELVKFGAFGDEAAA